MPSLSAVQSSNAQFAPSTRPVLVVFGGTSGIGAGIVRAFARHTHGRIHIVILGRSEKAAEEVIASLPQHAESQYEFEPVDAVLVANVRKTCVALSARLPKINYLVLSQGAAVFRAPDTEEGIHPFLALSIYGRVRAAVDLAPLLEKASAEGEDARVLSVLAAGYGGPVDLNDLGLKQALQAPLWKMGGIRAMMVTYTDTYILELAQRFPNISFTHVFPGFVASGFGREMPLPMRWLGAAMQVFARSGDDCGEYMMYALLDPAAKSGAHFKGDTAEAVSASPDAVGTTRVALWKHLEEATNV